MSEDIEKIRQQHDTIESLFEHVRVQLDTLYEGGHTPQEVNMVWSRITSLVSEKILSKKRSNRPGGPYGSVAKQFLPEDPYDDSDPHVGDPVNHP